MEERSREDFTWEQNIITTDKEVKELQWEGRLYKALSLLIAPASVIFFYNVDYPLASTKSYVSLGLGVLCGGGSLYNLLFGISLSREASRLEQKIFEERREQADNAQKNHYRR